MADISEERRINGKFERIEIDPLDRGFVVTVWTGKQFGEKRAFTSAEEAMAAVAELFGFEVDWKKARDG